MRWAARATLMLIITDRCWEGIPKQLAPHKIPERCQSLIFCLGVESSNSVLFWTSALQTSLQQGHLDSDQNIIQNNQKFGRATCFPFPSEANLANQSSRGCLGILGCANNSDQAGVSYTLSDNWEGSQGGSIGRDACHLGGSVETTQLSWDHQRRGGNPSEPPAGSSASYRCSTCTSAPGGSPTFGAEYKSSVHTKLLRSAPCCGQIQTMQCNEDYSDYSDLSLLHLMLNWFTQNYILYYFLWP